jgi:hypothetical protein
LWALDGLFLAMAFCLIWLAPGGGWKNEVFGTSLWWNGDPGVGYLVGSLYTFTGERRAFVGHPGAPIQTVVGVFAKLIHLIYQMGGGSENLYQFWARHMRWLFVLGGIIISIVHVISFHVIFAMARRLVNDGWVALLAVVAYATAFPVLHYSTRVSPEPLLVIAFGLTMIALWKVQERLDSGRKREAYRWAAVAGITSACAVYVKIHMGALLPVFACMQLLLQGGEGERVWARMRGRLGLLGVLMGAGVVTALLGIIKVDWPWFFQWWQKYAPGHHHARGAAAVTNVSALEGFFITMSDNAGKFLPRMTQEGVFGVVEGGFVIAALVAVIWFWKKYGEKREMIVWPLLYCALITPLILYRGLWHYTFLHLMVGVVPLAMLIKELTTRWISRPGMRVAAAVGLVLLMHSVSIVFFVHSRIFDIRKYGNSVRAYHSALRQLEPGERMAVIAPNGIPPRLLYGYWPDWISNANEFKESLSALIVVVKTQEELTEQFKKEQRIGVVVHRRMGVTRATAVEKFK